MSKSILGIFLISYVLVYSCATINQKDTSSKELELQLIFGRWKYEYSFNDTLKLNLLDLGDLPLEIMFFPSKKCDIKHDNKIQKIIKKSQYKNIWSENIGMPYGDTTFLIGYDVGQIIKIIQYSIKGEKFGEVNSYYILEINKTSLIVQNERLYVYNDEKLSLKHKYRKI
jgi:hypothetical protein